MRKLQKVVLPKHNAKLSAAIAEWERGEEGRIFTVDGKRYTHTNPLPTPQETLHNNPIIIRYAEDLPSPTAVAKSAKTPKKVNKENIVAKTPKKVISAKTPNKQIQRSVKKSTTKYATVQTLAR